MKGSYSSMTSTTASALADATQIPRGTLLLSTAAGKLEAAFQLLSEAALYIPADQGAVIQKFSERIELQHKLLRRIVFASRGGHRL
jgi:hypothetical protein